MLKTNSALKLVTQAVLILALGLIARTASADGPRVNLIFDNGTVLIYQGKEAGFREGQQLNVLRGAEVVGVLQALSVTPNYTQAKIISGTGIIVEGDLVAAAMGDAGVSTSAPSGGDDLKKKKSGDDTEKAADGKKDAKSDAKKADTKSTKKSAAGDADKKDTKSAKKTTSTSSKRRESAADKDADSGDAAEGDAAAGDDKGAKKSSKTDKKKDSGDSTAKAGSEKKQPEPQALARVPRYTLHMGYFFINDDLPGTNASFEPAPMISVSYWQPRKRRQNLVYNAMYTRPSVDTYYSSQSIHYQVRLMEFSAGIIWDDISGFGGKNVYGGFAVGWRSASSDIGCSVTCDGVVDHVEKSQEGVDYHGILGVRLSRKAEANFKYSFDEEYYTLDVGINN